MCRSPWHTFLIWINTQMWAWAWALGMGMGMGMGMAWAWHVHGHDTGMDRHGHAMMCSPPSQFDARMLRPSARRPRARGAARLPGGGGHDVAGRAATCRTRKLRRTRDEFSVFVNDAARTDAIISVIRSRASG